MRKSVWISLMIFLGISCTSTSPEESSGGSEISGSEGFHFTPRHGKENKTISLFKSEEIYHLIYATGSSEWGHAESPNLIHWKTVSSIDIPDGSDGDVIADVNNTSLLSPDGKEVWVMIFNSDGNIEIQYSLNKVEWLSPSYELPEGASGTPKISWYEPTEKWIMTLANRETLTFLSSEDLLTWSKESEYSMDMPVESARLISGKESWALLYNGEEVSYQSGDFNGSVFQPAGEVRSLDQSGLLSSATSFHDTERNVLIGQTRNNHLTSPWVVDMSNDALNVFPAQEFTRQITGKRRGKMDLLRGDRSSWFHFPIESVQERFELLISSEQGELLVIIGQIDEGKLIVDRKSAVKNVQGSKTTHPLHAESGVVEMDILIDYQQLELFVNQGESSYIIDITPQSIYDKIDVKVDGKKVSPRTVLYTISPEPFQ